MFTQKNYMQYILMSSILWTLMSQHATADRKVVTSRVIPVTSDSIHEEFNKFVFESSGTNTFSVDQFEDLSKNFNTRFKSSVRNHKRPHLIKTLQPITIPSFQPIHRIMKERPKSQPMFFHSFTNHPQLPIMESPILPVSLPNPIHETESSYVDLGPIEDNRPSILLKPARPSTRLPKQTIGPHGDGAGGCTWEGGFYRNGEKWYSRGCRRHICIQFREQFFTETDSCDTEIFNTTYKCVIQADTRKNYPECCPTYKCNPDNLGNRV